MTIDRLLFAAVALALGWVFVLDDNFAANLSRTINEFPPQRSIRGRRD